MSLVTRAGPPAEPTLCCGDHGTNDAPTQWLRDLMADGVDQPRASRIVWTGAPDVPTTPDDTAPWVRRTMRARLPWLRDGGAR